MSEVISKTLWLSAFLLAGCSGSVQDDRGAMLGLNTKTSYNEELAIQAIVQNSLPKKNLFLDNKKQKKCCSRLKKIGNQYTDISQNFGAISLSETESNGLNWHYILEAPVKGKIRHITFEEWLYLVDKVYLLNREKMNEFGLPTAKISPYRHQRSNESKDFFTEGRTIQF